MKKYELVCIYDPQVAEGNTDQVTDRYSNYISENGGEVVHTDVWGLRRMAYTSPALRNRNQGFYVVHQFHADPTSIEPMEQLMKRDTDLLRHLVVGVDNEFLRVPELVPEGYLMEQLAPPRRDYRGGSGGGRQSDDNRGGDKGRASRGDSDSNESEDMQNEGSGEEE